VNLGGEPKEWTIGKLEFTKRENPYELKAKDLDRFLLRIETRVGKQL